MEDINNKIEEIRDNFNKNVCKLMEARDSAFESILEDKCKIIDIDIRVDCLFANLNKNSSIKHYIRECKQGACDKMQTRCTKRLIIKNSIIFDWFSETLLNDRKFIKGTGGSNTDDPRVDEFKHFWEIPQYIVKSIKWYRDDCIIVNDGEHDKYVIDAQGYSYARYVGLCCDEIERQKQEALEEESSFLEANY